MVKPTYRRFFLFVLVFFIGVFSNLSLWKWNPDIKHLFPYTQIYSKIKETGISCENVLHNMTIGKWIPLRNPEKNASYYDSIYQSYRQGLLITEKLWRDDGKCGRNNSLPKMAASLWPELPGWCNPYGGTPCCDSAEDGKCIFSSTKCNCLDCVDMRNYQHSELSEWKAKDERCVWRNYSTATEACDVIERSPFNSIHFIGDSLMRNMYYAMLMILTDDPVSGAWSENMVESSRLYCRRERFFFTQCRNVIRSFDDLKQPEKLCGGLKPNFTVEATIPNIIAPEPYIDIIRSLVGREGSAIFLHIGLHMAMQAHYIIRNYLVPMLIVRQKYYESSSAATKWPRIYFVSTTFPGLTKPNTYWSSQGYEATVSFAEKIKAFCAVTDITYFDVSPFSKFVHSFDGTHYGLGVNLMKNQLLLNHLHELTNR